MNTLLNRWNETDIIEKIEMSKREFSESRTPSEFNILLREFYCKIDESKPGIGSYSTFLKIILKDILIIIYYLKMIKKTVLFYLQSTEVEQVKA